MFCSKTREANEIAKVEAVITALKSGVSLAEGKAMAKAAGVVEGVDHYPSAERLISRCTVHLEVVYGVKPATQEAAQEAAQDDDGDEWPELMPAWKECPHCGSERDDYGHCYLCDDGKRIHH